MRKNLLEFLFGPVAVETSQTLGEDVVRLFEEAADAETEQMVADKKPLSAALKDIGITNEVIVKEQAAEICCDDEQQYREHIALLTDPDAMHKLAEKGWVVARCGDQAMSNEPPAFKIGFIELNMLGMPANKQDAESLETVLKNAQKFATTPLDRDDDDLNPVETDDKTSTDNQKGVGKAKDGDDPKGKPKGASKSESLTAKDLARRMLDEGDLQEMTACSAIPAVEKPIGTAAPIGTPRRSRLAALRKRRGEDEQGRPNR